MTCHGILFAVWTAMILHFENVFVCSLSGLFIHLCAGCLVIRSASVISIFFLFAPRILVPPTEERALLLGRRLNAASGTGSLGALPPSAFGMWAWLIKVYIAQMDQYKVAFSCWIELQR